MIEYANPFKLYFAAATGSGGAFWSEAQADTYKCLRMGLLGHAFFFADSTVTENVQESYIRTQFERDDVDWLDSDSAPLILNIENSPTVQTWEPFQPHVTTETQAFATIEKCKTIMRIVREYRPTRQILWYGWTPDLDWYAIKNWLEVANNPEHASYASRLAWYQRWKKENERVRYGGSPDRKNNRGLFGYLDALMPWLYLPNDTTYVGATDWWTHPDCLMWSRVFQECTREAKRLYQKPVLPMVQFYKPETTTYLGNDWTRHTLDTAYADPNCDGVIIYHPTGGSTPDWRDTVAAWATARLGA